MDGPTTDVPGAAQRPAATVDGRSVAPSVRVDLPPQPTRLVGRDDEVTLVATLLRRADVRLLTLTGPGGVGKTRLALAAAESAAGAFPAGARFVDLAPLADPALVVPTIARTLGVRDVPALSPLEAVAAHLADDALLLVLDNLEHLLPAAPAVEALLAASPGLAVLTTSREPLRLRREQVVEVPPLAVPGVDRAAWSVADIRAVPGVALFVERAQAADAAFALNDGNAAAVAEICRRLDGLPLALELAAAHVRLLDPAALLARLEGGLALPRSSAPDLPPRQRTLRALLDWSHALLGDAERAVFRRLGAFAVGFGLEAIAAVAATDDLGVDPLDVLAALADKHLVRVLGGAEPRFRLLVTVREYALAQLEASGEAAATRDRHLGYFLALAEQSDRARLGRDEQLGIDRLEAEQDNLRLALEWAIACGQTEREWRLVAALWFFWFSQGDLRRGVERIEASLSRPYAAEPDLLARVLEGAGMLAEWLGDDARAGARYDRGLAAARAAGNAALAARLLGRMGVLAHTQGEPDRARRLNAEMLALARAAEAPQVIGLAFAHAVGFAIGPSGTARERERLLATLDEPVALLREARSHRLLAVLLAGRARLLAEVDASAALAPLREGLELARPLDDALIIGLVPWLAAVILAERLPAERIARLLGGVKAPRVRIAGGEGRIFADLYGAPADHAALARAAAAARATLGEEAFAAETAQGEAFSFEELIDEALAGLEEAELGLGNGEFGPADRAPREAGPLSPRELEVLALVAEGRSNKAIAAALYVSPNTVKTHVASLLSKLDAASRHQLPAIAARRGLLDG